MPQFVKVVVAVNKYLQSWLFLMTSLLCLFYSGAVREVEGILGHSQPPGCESNKRGSIQETVNPCHQSDQAAYSVQHD